MIVTGAHMIENATTHDIIETLQININILKRKAVDYTYFFADESSTHLSVSFGYKDTQGHHFNLSIVFSLINMSLDNIDHRKIGQKLTELERLWDT